METENPGLNWEKITEIINSYRSKKWPLIPMLQKIQEQIGYIPPETIDPIAEALNIFPAEVQGVITFYAGFTMKPKGKYVLRICRGTACHVKGGRAVLRFVKKELSLEEGETSKDYQFTLETVACLGACFLAPTMMVNRTYYGRLTPNKITSILAQYKRREGDE
ncbi:MAG: NADH-quinone oxidoreductase subunit NuoE [Deltaproteobacteria bacterium]|nr:NADH-quinone oxidoreductase subunit NuoE [Deltaproteobacteria bacterium]